MWLLILLCLLLAGPGRGQTPEPLELDDDSFDEAIAGKKVFLKLFAPWCGHCKQLAPTWNSLAAAAAASDTVVAKVDCTKPEAKATCARLDIKGYPTLKLIEKNVVYAYRGPRDLDSLQAFATEGYRAVTGELLRKAGTEQSAEGGAGEEHVVVVTDDNITAVETSGQTVMLEFYAPWCGHCTRLAPTYNELATKLAGDHPNIIAAKCDATESAVAAKRYQITGFPTLKVLKDGLMYDYNGGRTAEAMLQFLLAPSGPTHPIPGPWGWLDEVELVLTDTADDIRAIFTHKLAASVITLVAGVWIGCLLVAIVSCFIPKGPRKQVTSTSQAPQPPTSTESKKDK